MRGQIVVNFSPAIYGQSLDGLVYAQIINSSGSALQVVETITIREISGGNVSTIKTAPFQLFQGSNFISKAAFTNARFSFSNSYYGTTLGQTGRLPEGEYEYCFQTEITGSKPSQIPPFYENCFTLQLQPMTPLLLINPVDEDKICNKRPDLNWQLPVPLPADAKCRVLLTVIQEKQDIAEAIAFNLPVLNQGNVFGNRLMYPAGAPELKEGYRYVWQVTVYAGKTILKKSEIWTFTVQCEEEQKSQGGDSYRELKETDDGNFYIASKSLRFSFNNPYSMGNLDYTIEGISDPQSAIKKLPKLKMNAGQNNYELDLSDNSAFKDGSEYLIRVRLINNRELTLRFIYKNE
jgi:hypothetical protein